jgi:tetratricopeptide (TPR) repeat protein
VGLFGVPHADGDQVVITVVGWTGLGGCEARAEWQVTRVAHGAVFVYEGAPDDATSPGDVLSSGGRIVAMRGWEITDGTWTPTTRPIAAILQRGVLSEEVACVQHDTPEAADRLATAMLYEELGSPSVSASAHHDVIGLSAFHGGPLADLFETGTTEFPADCLSSPVFRAATLSFGAEPTALDMSRSAAILTLHASNAFDRMDWEIAAEAISAALAQTPGYGPALFLRGRLEEEVNINLVAAGDAFSAAAAGDQRLRAAATYRMGLISEDVGELEAAAAQYESAADSDTGYADPANALGFLAFEAGDYGLARTMFQEALSRAPTFAQAANNLGYIAENVDGDPVVAEQWYRRAAAIEPDSSSTLVNLAAVLGHHLGGLVEAESLLRQAMALDARNADALASLEALMARPAAEPGALAGTWSGTRGHDGAALTVTFGPDGSAAIVTRMPGGEPTARRFATSSAGAHRTQRVYGEEAEWTVEVVTGNSAYLYPTESPLRRTLLTRRDGGVAIAL